MMISGPVANNFSGAFQNPGWEIESVPAAKKIPKSMKGLPELPEGYVWEPCRVDPKPGAIFVPGKHKPYNTADYPNHLNFCHAMLPFIGKVTTVRASRGPDSSGKWTISIDADDGMFNYRWMNGWILKRDGVVVTKEGLPEGLELFSQTVKVGFPDTNLVGDRMDGCWEYFNGKSADLKEGDEFILGPYAILNMSYTKAQGDNVYVQYYEDIDSTLVRMSIAPSGQLVGKTARVIEDGLCLGVATDWLGMDTILLETDAGRVYWRVDSLIQKTDESNFAVQQRRTITQLTGTIDHLTAELTAANNMKQDQFRQILQLERQVADLRSEAAHQVDYKNLYLSVQRLLTRYFINNGLDTSNVGDARVLDQLAQRYRAVRGAITEARKGKQ